MPMKSDERSIRLTKRCLSRVHLPSLRRDGGFICRDLEQKQLRFGGKVRMARAGDDDGVVAEADRGASQTQRRLARLDWRSSIAAALPVPAIRHEAPHECAPTNSEAIASPARRTSIKGSPLPSGIKT